MTYQEFLETKIELAQDSGFVVAPEKINQVLKPHQRDAVAWALKGGRRALFESFGLGKTVQELEFCHLAAEHEKGRALIVLPLGVKQEFTRDAVEILGYERPTYCRAMDEVKACDSRIVLTNYERVRDGDIDPSYFVATSLDEASVLRSFGSKTYQTFLDKFKNVPYKLVATATPSPNKYKELIHYAGYLEVMDTGQALTRFFQRDSTKANHLTLYPNMEDEFWLWISSWALFITKPSDLNPEYSDEGYDLPPLEVRWHEIPIHYGDAKDALMEKWKNHNHMVDKMIAIVKKYGLNAANKAERLERKMGVEGTREERTVQGAHYTAVYGDCVEETRAMEDNSVDLIHTSIPFGNHYEYSANYNDFGHNQNTDRFFEQMDYLTPELLRVLKPGRVAAIHVKDRVLFGNATGTGMPTIEPFHAVCIEHYMKHGFQYFGMITVVTDVVRENNLTYRLGWSEQCKDGSKMGVGCPEYILLFRKLPTDRSTAYADTPVKKSKEDYTRAQWQIDAHAYWRSSGDCLISKEDLQNASVDTLQAVYREYSRDTVYNYDEHVALAKKLDTEDRLPATFMVVAPGSWNQLEVWDDINRMRTLNTTQSRRRAQMHVCPLQLDIVERIINRYSNEGDVVYDPFGGLMTVPMMAVKMHRYGKGCELNPDYFRDGVGYLEVAESEVDMPTLFDLFPSVV